MKRVLRSLRLGLECDPWYRCTQGTRSPGWETIVGVGITPSVRPVITDVKFAELQTGDIVERSGVYYRVKWVKLEDVEPADQIGRVVMSGTCWLRGYEW